MMEGRMAMTIFVYVCVCVIRRESLAQQLSHKTK